MASLMLKLPLLASPITILLAVIRFNSAAVTPSWGGAGFGVSGPSEIGLPAVACRMVAVPAPALIVPKMSALSATSSTLAPAATP